jgi:hypothetical protein
LVRWAILGQKLSTSTILRDPDGNVIDPSAYWDAQGPIDPNPAPPAYVGEHQQYLRNRSTNDFYGFGGAPGSTGVPTPSDASSGAAPPLAPAKPIRRLTTRIGDALPSVVQRVTAPSVQPNELPTPHDTPSFNDRFGSWVSSPSAGAPLNPYRVQQPTQATPPLGIVTGEPVPSYPVPPPIWGFPDQLDEPGRETWSEAKLKRPDWPRR